MPQLKKEHIQNRHNSKYIKINDNVQIESCPGKRRKTIDGLTTDKLSISGSFLSMPYSSFTHNSQHVIPMKIPPELRSRTMQEYSHLVTVKMLIESSTVNSPQISIMIWLYCFKHTSKYNMY